MALILYLVMGFALTNAIVFLHFGHGFRRLVSGLTDFEFYALARERNIRGLRQGFWGRLVRCHACFGFWIGCLLSLEHGGFIVEYMKTNSIAEQIIGDGLLLSGFNFVLWLVLRRLGAEEL